MHEILPHISLEISAKMSFIIHHENNFMLVKICFRNVNCCSTFKINKEKSIWLNG